MRNKLKSVISDHTATVDEILTRAGDVMECGHSLTDTRVSNTHISVYQLGYNIYILTFINDMLVSFELKDIYCFILPSFPFNL